MFFKGSAVTFRLNNLSEDETQRFVIMGNKGCDATKLTLMLPDSQNKSQSPYNHQITHSCGIERE